MTYVTASPVQLPVHGYQPLHSANVCLNPSKTLIAEFTVPEIHGHLQNASAAMFFLRYLRIV